MTKRARSRFPTVLASKPHHPCAGPCDKCSGEEIPPGARTFLLTRACADVRSHRQRTFPYVWGNPESGAASNLGFSSPVGQIPETDEPFAHLRGGAWEGTRFESATFASLSIRF